MKFTGHVLEHTDDMLYDNCMCYLPNLDWFYCRSSASRLFCSLRSGARFDRDPGHVCFPLCFQYSPSCCFHLTLISFYFEEHARKIGIWGWSILIGPYFGPFLSSMILHNIHWRESFWIVVGIVGFGLLLVIFLMEETTYDRVVPENNPPQPEGCFKRKLFALVGITGHRMKGRPSLCQGTWELIMVFVKPQFYMLCKFQKDTFIYTHRFWCN